MLCFDKQSRCLFVSVVVAAAAYTIRFGAKGAHDTSSSPNFACTVSGSVLRPELRNIIEYSLLSKLPFIAVRYCTELHTSAEELQICWGDNSMYWEMVPNHDTEFPNNIARLKAVCWFDVKGEFVCSLPPGTYTVSWRAYLSADARGWESDAVSFTFSKKQNDTEDISRCKCYLKRSRSSVALTQPEPTIRAVGNGWTEYDVGDFAVEAGQGNLALEFAMVATSDYWWKSGLSLDGVVIRPKSLVDATVPLRPESSSAGVPDAAGGR